MTVWFFDSSVMFHNGYTPFGATRLLYLSVCAWLCKHRQAFYCFLFDVEWVGGREENGYSPVFFLTAWLPPTLSTIQRFLHKNCLYFYSVWVLLVFGRYARSGYPMDCNTFHSLSLTHFNLMYGFCLSTECIRLYTGQGRNFSAFLPDKYRYIVGSPLPARLYHIPCKKSRANGRIYIKSFSYTREKIFYINLHRT